MDKIFFISDVAFYLYFLYFLIAIFFTFFIPGIVLSFKLKLTYLEKLILSPVIGVCLWALQAYFFGYSNLRFFSYLYLIILNISFFYLYKTRFKTLKKIHLTQVLKKHKLTLCIITLGVILQLLSVFGSGFKMNKGVIFFWLNGADGIMHLSFIKSLINQVPPIQPGLWPNLITNYHYLSDLVVAQLARVWHLPITHLYFQYLPIFISTYLGLTAYYLVKLWTKSIRAAHWSLFFLYFSGDMFYFFLLIFHQTFGTYTDTIDNGMIQLLNMPQAFAKLIFFTGLIFFNKWFKNKDKTAALMTIILFSSLVGFKVYFGIFVAMGLSFVFAAQFIRNVFKQLKTNTSFLKALSKTFGKQKYFVLLMLLFIILSSLLYFPTNKAAGGLFYVPLNWPKLLLGYDKLDWNEWWLRLQVYQAANNQRALFVYYSLAVIIFLIAVYGSRLIGLLITPAVYKKLKWYNFFFLVPGVIIFTILGMNTLQTSGAHNVFNFFVVALVILGLCSAVVMDYLTTKKQFIFKLFGLLIIALNLPIIITTARQYVYNYIKVLDCPIVTHANLEALTYLKENTPKDAIIQTHLQNNFDKYTPYMLFFSNRYSYLGGINILESHNQDIKERQKVVKTIFDVGDFRITSREMAVNKIDYLYVQKNEREMFKHPVAHKNLEIAFENEEVLIIKLVTK